MTAETAGERAAILHDDELHQHVPPSALPKDGVRNTGDGGGVLTGSLRRSYPWAVGFFFGNTELSLALRWPFSIGLVFRAIIRCSLIGGRSYEDIIAFDLDLEDAKGLISRRIHWHPSHCVERTTVERAFDLFSIYVSI